MEKDEQHYTCRTTVLNQTRFTRFSKWSQCGLVRHGYALSDVTVVTSI